MKVFDTTGQQLLALGTDAATSQTLSVLSQAVSVISQQVSVLSQAVSVLSQAHSALSQQVSVLSSQVSVVSVAVTSVDTRVNTVSQGVSVVSQALSVQAAALSVRVDTQSQAISVISQQVSVLSQAVSVLSQSLSALSHLHSALSQTVSVLSSLVSVNSAIGGGKYACAVQMSTVTAIANGAVVTLGLSAERFDPSNMHLKSVTHAFISITVTGYYYVCGEADFAGNATGERYIALILNGAAFANNRQPNNGLNVQYMNVAGLISATATDNVGLIVFQNSGLALSVDSGFLAVALVGR